jgi:hypothetical protein
MNSQISSAILTKRCLNRTVLTPTSRKNFTHQRFVVRYAGVIKLNCGNHAIAKTVSANSKVKYNCRLGGTKCNPTKPH